MVDDGCRIVAADHDACLRLLRSAINVQNAMLEVELGIMSLDGNVMSVT